MVKKYKVVWYDGFQRVREEVELVGVQDGVYYFKDADDETFHITSEQLIKMD